MFEESIPEVLFSRPLLQAIGFDLDEHLGVVRDKFHECDFSHIGFPQAEPSSTVALESPRKGSLSRLLSSKVPPTDITLPNDEDPRYSLERISKTATGPSVDPGTNKRPDDIHVGKHDPAEIWVLLEEMIQSAMDHGLPLEFRDDLSALVLEYTDIFRVRLGSDPSADTTPIKVSLKENYSPIRVKVRRNPPSQAPFLRKRIDELRELELVYPNPSSQWASAPLIVPKAGPEEFRFTIDLRPVNFRTVPHVWPVPDLEFAVGQLAEDVCYTSLDLCHGYWQLQLHQDSQQCQSFIAPDGVFSPTRVMHGQTNAVSYLQSSFQLLTEGIRKRLLQWLDDILLHCRSASELLHVLRDFFGYVANTASNYMPGSASSTWRL